MASKYWNSYLRFLRNSVATDMEYRVSFLFKNITGLVWMVGALFFIQVIFSQATSVAGWSKIEITYLYLSFSIAVDLYNLIFKNSLHEFSRLVRHGRLDMFMIKPINLRFSMSFMTGEVGTYVTFRLLAAIYLLFYFNHLFQIDISITSFIIYFIFIIVGSISLYSISFLLHTLNIWLVRLYNFTELMNQSYELGKIPVNAWPKYVQTILIYVFPIAVVSSVATRSLLGEISLFTLGISIFIALVLFILSHLFFVFALRHYSSASS